MDTPDLCGGPYGGGPIELMLTKCLDEKFTCNSGQCVAMEKRCDNIVDCRDESDEEECKSFVLKRSYNKFSAPITNVTVDISLEDIVSIKDFDNEIDLKTSITLKWTESRATYRNLKENKAKNKLQEQDIEKLWIPKLIFQNSKEKHDTASDLSKSKLFISREGDKTWSSNEVTEDIAEFQGNENPLVMTHSSTLNFKCDFDFKLFPFDTQVMCILQIITLSFVPLKN